MSNDFQKSPLFFLLLCLLPSMYAMEKLHKDTSQSTSIKISPDPNEELLKAVDIAIKNKCSKQEYWENIKQWLDCGADVNCRIPRYNITVLNLAVMYKNREIVDYLLSKGADVTVCAKNGLPLLFALFKSTSKNEKLDIQIFENLLKKGASPNGAQTWKETPLSYAIWNGYNDAVKLLINYNSDVNLKNPECAPLQLAILKKDFDIIKELREAGAVLHDIDLNSSTALHYMIGNKKNEIKNFIKHICIASYDKKQNELFKQTVTGALLTFKKLNERSGFPQIYKDLQLYIINILLKKNCYDFVLSEVYEHIKLLKETSEIQDKDNRTALQLLHHNYAQYPTYINNVGKFFHPNLIENDWEDFMKVYPNTSSVSEDNVARIVYDNYLSLINNK